MKALVATGLGLAGFLCLAWIVWRAASRGRSLPCPVWLRWLVEFDNPLTKTTGSKLVVQRLNARPGMRVLDVGCGPGRLTIPIARTVGPEGEVVAVDVQPGMLRRAEERARSAGLANIRFVQVDAGGAGLGSGLCDRAILVTVLGEIPDRESALNAIFEALKPGGMLSVTEIMLDPHYQGRDTILRLAVPLGFQEVALFGNRFAFTLNLEKPLDSA